MFTGIIEEVGTVERLVLSGQTGVLSVNSSRLLEGLKIGDSIAVNGVCLTAVSLSERGFSADTSAETLRKTNLGELKPGDGVNLERPLRLGDRLGGHLVSGHVDGLGRVQGIVPEGESFLYRFELPEELERYVVHEGSISVDGISLTVARLHPRAFEVAVIPFTVRETNLGGRKPGDRVNLEVDMLGRYVERLMTRGRDKGKEEGGISRDFLGAHGFLQEGERRDG